MFIRDYCIAVEFQLKYLINSGNVLLTKNKVNFRVMVERGTNSIPCQKEVQTPLATNIRTLMYPFLPL